MPDERVEKQFPYNTQCAWYLSELLYAWKFGMKDKYYRVLEKVKPIMNTCLYNFFYNFGFNQFMDKKR